MMNIKQFLSRVEKRPSPINGYGVFAKLPIQNGTYITRGRQTAWNKLNIFAKTEWLNSPLMPPFVELLSLDRGNSTLSEANAPIMKDRLAKLRSGFSAYVEEERSLATYAGDFSVASWNLTYAAIVHRDIDVGEELLRGYGDEWIPMKHFHYELNLQYVANSLSQEGNDETRT